MANFGICGAKPGCDLNSWPTLGTLVKVKVKFTLEQATKVQKGSIGIALLSPKPRR